MQKSAEKSQKLKEANKQQNFNTGIKDFDFWLSEVPQTLSGHQQGVPGHSGQRVGQEPRLHAGKAHGPLCPLWTGAGHRRGSGVEGRALLSASLSRAPEEEAQSDWGAEPPWGPFSVGQVGKIQQIRSNRLLETTTQIRVFFPV